MLRSFLRLLPCALFVLAAGLAVGGEVNERENSSAPARRLLYVAAPGVRNLLEYGGHGLLVFDIDQGHSFVKRIPTDGFDDAGKPLNVKGICASVALGRVYISTTRRVMCIDLITESLLWDRAYDGGCDRMAISPDGTILYVPSFEGPHWNVISGETGDVVARITPNSGAHNTVYGRDGRFVYLAGLKSPLLTVADTRDHTVARTVGPFSAEIRPFTVDGRQARCYVNVNGLLGFEVGDLATGKMIHRVEVQGFTKGPVKRHGCPSHGVGLTPDEREIWVTDAANQRLHVFDATVMPPKQLESIELRDEPGWVTFSLDGKYAYPSTGDVIEEASRKIVARLTDEEGRAVGSEKMLEIDMTDGRPTAAGDQFGIGRARGEGRGVRGEG
jgi:DNA-binding beta-propeller fold protein YncE